MKANTNKTICKIHNDFLNGCDISWGELAILGEHKQEILRQYHDEPSFCEFAGIDEQEFNDFINGL